MNGNEKLETHIKVEEVKSNISLIYNKALAKNFGLPEEKAVPTIKKKLAAVNAALTKATQNYQKAQAEVDKYKTQGTSKSEEFVAWGKDDFRLAHWKPESGSHKSELRKLIWGSIYFNGRWPIDLEDAIPKKTSNCDYSAKDPAFMQLIAQETASRKEKDRIALEAKKTKEEIKETYDLLKSYNDKLVTRESGMQLIEWQGSGPMVPFYDHQKEVAQRQFLLANTMNYEFGPLMKSRLVELEDAKFKPIKIDIYHSYINYESSLYIASESTLDASELWNTKQEEYNKHSPVQEELNRFIETQSIKQFPMYEPIHYLYRQSEAQLELAAKEEEESTDAYPAPGGLIINYFELQENR